MVASVSLMVQKVNSAHQKHWLTISLLCGVFSTLFLGRSPCWHVPIRLRSQADSGEKTAGTPLCFRSAEVQTPCSAAQVIQKQAGCSLRAFAACSCGLNDDDDIE